MKQKVIYCNDKPIRAKVITYSVKEGWVDIEIPDPETLKDAEENKTPWAEHDKLKEEQTVHQFKWKKKRIRGKIESKEVEIKTFKELNGE